MKPAFNALIRLTIPWEASKSTFILARMMPNEYRQPSIIKLTNLKEKIIY
jgi:hypothetical protein